MEVKEKTAEEIKSEVLKAAKERTKAKSKLFPQKGKIDAAESRQSVESSSSTTLTSSKTDESTRTADYESSRALNLKSEIKSEYSEGLKVSKEQFESTESRSDTDKGERTDSASISEKPNISRVISSEVQEKEEVIETEKLSPDDSVTSKEIAKSGDPGVAVIYSEQDTSELIEDCVAKIDISVAQTVTTSLSGSVLSMLSDLQESEQQAADMSKDSSFQELTIDTGDQFESFSGELVNMDRSSSGNDLLQISDTTDEVLSEHTSENQSYISGENEHYRNEEISSAVKLKGDLESLHETDKENENKVLSLDVSSSVEIVSAKDIPLLDNEFSAQSESTSCPQVISDTNKEISEASQSDTYSVIDEMKLETLEDIDSDTKVHQEDSLDAISKESEQQTCALEDSSSLYTDRSQSESTIRSESESSINKLDVSQETCTSEETVIEEELNASGTTESIRGNLSKNVESVSSIECSDLENEIQAENSASLFLKNRTEPSKDSEIENERLVSEDVKLESQNTTKKETSSPHKENDSELRANLVVEETSDGSDSGEKSDLSPANSFVKCTLEDAMVDSKDDNSDNHSGSRSIHSGHESGDEIDTTTSSDIEIISMPTPNGENRQVSFNDILWLIVV